MGLYKIFCLFVLFILSTTVRSLAADGRDLIVQKEMDCVDKHLQQNGTITWNDVCDMPESSYQQHMEAVNEQMDQAQQSSPKRVLISQDLPKKNDWVFGLAPEVSYIRYHELVGGHSFMKQFGTMSGLDGTFTFRPPEGNYLNTEMTDVYRFEGRFSYGKVDYHGGIQNGDGTITPENFDGISDYMTEIRTLMGKDFNFNHESTRLTPYAGAGYRQLFDASFANKPFGYNRRIQYLYAPIGMDVMNKMIDGWCIDANAEYDFLIRGFVTSDLEEIGLGQLNNTQGKGYGVRGSIKLIKNGDRFNLIFEPFVRFWHIHESKVGQSAPFDGFVLIGDEPDNNSLEIGGRLGIEF